MQVVSQISLSEKIQSIISEKSMLKHPFYLKWTEGKLTQIELQEYAKQYFHFMSQFPRFISAIHSNCDNAEARQLLMENLCDEEGWKTGIPSHPSLWADFAQGLGVSVAEMENTQYHAETKALVEGFRKATNSPNYWVGIATMFAYEAQIPEVAKTKIEGLKDFYGIADEQTYRYFSVHETADVTHAAQEMEILEEAIAQNAGAEAEILAAVEQSTELVWKFLDGVYNNHCLN